MEGLCEVALGFALASFLVSSFNDLHIISYSPPNILTACYASASPITFTFPLSFSQSTTVPRSPFRSPGIRTVVIFLVL